MPKRNVTPQDIQKINELYLTLHTYAAVSREIGFSPTTVKKYIIENYNSCKQEQKKNSNYKYTIVNPENLPPFPKTSESWRSFLKMSDEEKAKCEILRKEIFL